MICVFVIYFCILSLIQVSLANETLHPSEITCLNNG